MRFPTGLLRKSCGIGVILAEHLHVAAEREGRDAVIGAAAREPEEPRAEAEREDLDLHARPLGDEEVPQLVDEDQDADPEHGRDRAVDRGANALEARESERECYIQERGRIQAITWSFEFRASLISQSRSLTRNRQLSARTARS
jgi:hypothetical protein